MHIFECGDPESFDSQAKEVFVNSIAEAIKRKGRAIIAIPGGRSVVGMFSKLNKKDLDWSKVDLFMIDERMVPMDHKNSNYLQAKKLFIDAIPKIHAHPFDITKGLQAYNKELFDVTEGEMQFDVVLLSSGEDGHIGALYPNHESVMREGKMFFDMTDSPKPPPKRMTASRRMIEDSSSVILLFYGDGKRNAFKLFEDKRLGLKVCPAKLVKSVPRGYVITMFSK